MALKDTILGWLGRTPDKSDELEDAEIDAATKEYSEERTDNIESRSASAQAPDEFESDQSAPRH